MTMRARTNSGRSLRCVLLGLAVLAPATARADVDAALSASAPVTSVTPAPLPDRGAGFVGAKLGAYLPQAFSPLGASFYAEVEGGYLLPFFRRALGISASFGFSMPQVGGSGIADPRVSGGSYSYDQPSQQFLLGLTVVGRIPLGRFMPYVGVGPRYSIVRTPSTGASATGSAIDQSLETSRQVGVGVPVGLDVTLGPGRLFAEAQLLWAQSPQRSTGPASFGSILAAAGYRLVS